MGLTLEFYIGHHEKIVNAIREGNLDLLYHDNDVVHRIADLSLHIVPEDLNLLSRQFGERSNQDPLDLRPYLEVLIDEPDHGLLFVDNQWVRYVAKVDENRLDEIVTNWFNAMAKEYPDEDLEVTDDAKRAVQNLWDLCREAAQSSMAVFHAWFA